MAKSIEEQTADLKAEVAEAQKAIYDRYAAIPISMLSDREGIRSQLEKNIKEAIEVAYLRGRSSGLCAMNDAVNNALGRK